MGDARLAHSAASASFAAELPLGKATTTLTNGLAEVLGSHRRRLPGWPPWAGGGKSRSRTCAHRRSSWRGAWAASSCAWASPTGPGSTHHLSRRLSSRLRRSGTSLQLSAGKCQFPLCHPLVPPSHVEPHSGQQVS